MIYFKLLLLFSLLLNNSNCFIQIFKYNNINNLKMSNYDNFNWNKNWYPIAVEKFTNKKKPFKFTLLNKDLVVWWDFRKKEWNTVYNICPHRLVPLSEGRINDNGNIECPYHGWSFNKNGECENIPQIANYKKQKKYCTNSFKTITKQGLIWVWPDNNKTHANEKSIPIFKELNNKNTIYFDTFTDLPYDYTLLLENVLDISHIPFTHHKSQGFRENSAPLKFNKPKYLNSKGFKIYHNLTFPSNTKNNKINKSYTKFIAPCLQYTKVENKNMKIIIPSYAIPIKPGYCRVISRLPIITFKNFKYKLFGFLLKLQPTFIHHMFINSVIEEDTILLYNQQNQINKFNNSKILDNYLLASESDIPVILWHKWLNNVNKLWKLNDTDRVYYNKKELINRELLHYQYCTVCQNANKNLQNIKTFTLYFKPIIFLLIWPLLNFYYPLNHLKNKIICMSAIISSTILWYICNTIQNKFKVGKYPHKRNLVYKNLFS
tara:strand:- start:1122 stop:2591 length:1470 start_codon:yes stop_codon:yes gene_type:complete